MRGLSRTRGSPTSRRADELVERHLIGLGQREQQLEAGLALAALQPRQRALGDPGLRGQRRQRHAAPLAQPPQAGADLGQDVRDRRRSPHGRDATGRSRKRQRNLPIRAPVAQRRRMELQALRRAIIGGGAAGLSAALVLGRAQAPGRRHRRRNAAQRTRRAHAGLPVPRRHAAGRAAGRRARRGPRLRRGDSSTTASSRSTAGFALRLAGGRTVDGAARAARDGRRRRAARHPGRCASAGAATSCTARTATAGRCATSRSACSDRPRLRRARAPAAPVDGRRDPLHAHGRRHRRRARGARRRAASTSSTAWSSGSLVVDDR